MYPMDLQTAGKKWRTETIIKEVFDAISQLERVAYES